MAEGYVVNAPNAQVCSIDRHTRLDDARLIAAAPELYAACELALELFEGEDPASSADSYAAAYAARIERRDQIEQSIRLAIAKARKGGGE